LETAALSRIITRALKILWSKKCIVMKNLMAVTAKNLQIININRQMKIHTRYQKTEGWRKKYQNSNEKPRETW
jgi:hypothetical protein